MTGRAIERDKPDVKAVEAPHTPSPAHREVDASQRAASVGRDSRPATEPKELDLSHPIGGTAKEFDASPANRGLARDSAPSATTGGTDGKLESGSSGSGAGVDAAKARPEAKPDTGSSSRYENSRVSMGDITQYQTADVRSKSLDQSPAKTDAAPTAGPSINDLSKQFVSQNPNQHFRNDVSNNGADGQNENGAQFKLTLNPNSAFKSGVDNGVDGKAFRDSMQIAQPQVPTNLTDAPLTTAQKSINQQTPAAQKAEADSLLKKQAGQSRDQNAQIDANLSLVNRFNQGVHRESLIKQAGSGQLGEQGGRVVAGMTESKAFRIEGTKLANGQNTPETPVAKSAD